MKKSLIIVSVIFIIAFVVVGQVNSASTTNVVVRDPNNVPAKNGANCDVSTASAVNVGDDLSTRVIATSSTRAFTRISLNNNATNTAFVSFDKDAAATINNGLILNGAFGNGASTTPYIDFGLTTDFPYTGSVTAITNYGTTTLLVTSCSY